MLTFLISYAQKKKILLLRLLFLPQSHNQRFKNNKKQQQANPSILFVYTRQNTNIVDSNHCQKSPDVLRLIAAITTFSCLTLFSVQNLVRVY